LLWHQNSVLDFMTYHIKNQPTMMIQNIFLSGLCVYIITNPMNVEYILKTNSDNYQKGHFIKHIFGEILGKGIFNIDGKHWKLQWGIVSCEFTSKSFQNFMRAIIQVELNDWLIPLLAKTCKVKVSIDLQNFSCILWRAPKSRGETHLRVSQSQVAESWTW